MVIGMDARGDAPGGAGAQLQEANGSSVGSLVFLDTWNMRCDLTEQLVHMPLSPWMAEVFYFQGVPAVCLYCLS